MPRPDIDEFSVDLQARTVTHTCGTTWSYYEYPNREDWETTLGTVDRIDAIPGDTQEYAIMAKLAAKREGMQNTKGAGR